MTIKILGPGCTSCERLASEVRSVLAELQLLVVHGVLHLLGYDDQSDGHRAKMWAVQSEVLQALGLDINPPL